MRLPFAFLFALTLFASAKDDTVRTQGESTRGLRFPTLSPDNKRVAFTFAGDIWVAPVAGGAATRVTLHPAYDTKPRWSPDGKSIAFVSDRAGSYDVWVTSPEGGVPTQLTFHSAADIVNSWSPDGKWVLFESDRDGETDVWTVSAQGGTERKITRHGGSFPVVTPDGKWLVYCYGTAARNIRDYKGSGNWDIYVCPFEGGPERRLTTWEGNDFFPMVSADGQTVYYVSEHDARYQIWQVPLAGGEPKPAVVLKDVDVQDPCLSWDGKTIAFENDYRLATVQVDGSGLSPIPIEIRSDAKDFEVHKRTLTVGAKDPDLSRDGKWITFSLGGDIWIMSAGGGKARRLTEGPPNDEWPRFSPDGSKIAYFSDASGTEQIWIVASDGGTPVQFTSGDKNNFYHSWSPDGERLVFTSERSGNRDIWTQDLAGGEAVQLTRAPGPDDDANFSPDGKMIAFDSDRSGNQEVWVMGADGKNPRQVTFTPGVNQTPFWSPDGKMIAFEKMKTDAHVLYVISADGGDEMQLSPDGEHPTWSSDGTRILFSTERGGRRGIYQIAAPKEICAGTEIPVMAEYEVARSKEMKQTFEEAWTALRNGFYDPKLHGVNWDAVKTRYAGLIDTCETKEELYYFISQMIGELKASHMGISGEGSVKPCPETGVLAATLVPSKEGAGLLVTDVVKNGPADQAWIRVGDRVLAIEGSEVGARKSYFCSLAGKVGQSVKLRVAPAGDEKNAREVALKPLSHGQLSQLLYDNWLAERNASVEEKGKGEIAYIHLTAMDQDNLNLFLRELAGPARDKKALIIDVRNNGGGNIHQELLDVLSRKPFGETRPRGGKNAPAPDLTWAKPVAVLVNENSYSDAEVFPYGFQKTGLGPVIGVPTPGGVIGTTDITLSDGSTLRIPRVGWFGKDGTDMEGCGVKPDFVVELTPEDREKGRDPQLDKAIEVLLSKLGSGTTAKVETPKDQDPPKQEEQQEPRKPKPPRKPKAH